MTPLIELRGVGKTFSGGAFGGQQTVALEPLSFAIDADRPQIIAVVGESGSGKTTLARLLLGLIPPTQGSVSFLGRDLRTLTRAERRVFRQKAQVVFQDPYEVYNPFYRVDHVLTTPLRRFRLAATAGERRIRIEDALRAVGLQPDEILGRYPHQLSGGQRQRIMVARALLLRPGLIVADEPVSMVDASLRATILNSLRSLTVERGISILYITHDLATAYQIADRMLVLYRASLVEAGSVEQVVRAPSHPYTRMLIGAIPRVSTTRDWVTDSASRDNGLDGPGCRFANRCPSATDRCARERPGLYKLEGGQAASCFLYDQSPSLPYGDITTLLS